MTEGLGIFASNKGLFRTICPRLRNAVSAVCLLMGASPVLASQLEVFKARCLDSFEHHALPILGTLEPFEEGEGYTAYGLPEGYVLIYDTEPEDAEASCSIVGRNVRKEILEFEIWALEQVQQERYAEVDGMTWHSTTWIEPKVAVQLRVDAQSVTFRVMETDLES